MKYPGFTTAVLLLAAFSLTAAPPMPKVRYYKPCIEKPAFETPIYERSVREKPVFEKAQFEKARLEKPVILQEIRLKPVIEKAEFVEPEIVAPCWDTGQLKPAVAPDEKVDPRQFRPIPFRRDTGKRRYTTVAEIHHSPFRGGVKPAPAPQY